mgnify:CR=1 FL=1
MLGDEGRAVSVRHLPQPRGISVHWKGRRQAHFQRAAALFDGGAVFTWPVDVWFGGSRTFEAVLDFGGRAVTSITFDPQAL